MSFSDFQSKINEARGNSETSRLVLKTAKQKFSNNRRREKQRLREISDDAQANDPQLIEIRKQAEQFAASVRTSKSDYATALKKEWERLTEFEDFTDPTSNLEHLPDNWPILLLPLRLETRFKKVTQDNETVDQLWVRIFPDDIAINSFESDLSETEIRNAQSYWLVRWKAGKDIGGNRAAWRSLAMAHGPGRAYWLISEDRYVPVNKDAEPTIGEGQIILAIGTDEPLVDPELTAIVNYWKSVWLADTDKQALDDAWQALTDQLGEERANALIQDYKPANLNDPPPAGHTRDNTEVRIEFVIFKKTDALENKLHTWSQPPTTSILPERFVFMAYHDDNQEILRVGNLVRPELILGPDPASEEGEDFRLATEDDVVADPSLTLGDLIYSDNMHWMFDFDTALQKGMGFKINLTPDQAARGFDRVLVLGVKLSLDKETCKTKLQDLFGQHQFSRKGMSIVKQGTPTNNTEDDESGHSWKHDPDESFDHYLLSEFEEAEPEPEMADKDWFDKSDGEWLADMLGINRSAIINMPNYTSMDICEALAMQKALWPATMGHFMQSMMHPVFSDEDIEQTRLFFTRLVTGRGLIPAIRVGKQPYGILPANNYTNMAWFSPPSHDDHIVSAVAIFRRGFSFLESLYAVLMDMDKVWESQRTRISFVGKENEDAHQLLLDVVGLHPDSVELYKRYANTVKQIHNIYNLQSYSHAQMLQFIPTKYASAQALLASYGYVIDDKHPEPEIFKLSFFENSYLMHGDTVDSVPVSETEELQISASDDRNYIKWLIDAAEDSHHTLQQQDNFLDDTPPSALLYLMLQHALDLSYIDTSLKLHLAKGILSTAQVTKAYVEPDLIHVEEANETESHWKYLYKFDERITETPDLLIGTYIAQQLDTLDEAAPFRDVLSGLRKLEHVETARLERALMEHIDTVSYRYDAWLLGFLNLQLALMRGLSIPAIGSTAATTAGDAAESERDEEKQGLYIGAYGWLEDLTPEDKQLTPVELPEELDAIFNPDKDLVADNTNAGYILAPSQNHAVTAAILRNGHLSDRDPQNREALKIKLSSERVRLALQIIEGIQAGQTLAALLGYQFERGLHDRTDAEVDQFVFKLRMAFPLVAKNLKDTAPEDDEYDSISQIEARNVIDGVAFLEHLDKLTTIDYPFNLDQAPFNLDMPTANDDERNAINDEARRLIDINDTVSDLALAESVHQVVLGNYETANATMETYSKGNFPPTPLVIQTPRSGTTLTHRVAIHLKTGLHHNLADPGVTPRMLAEPAIHDWLTKVIPDMTQIECIATYTKRSDASEVNLPVTMQDIGISVIDLLYLLHIESDQAMSSLDDLIVHHVIASGDSRLDQPVTIEYTKTQTDGRISVFELSSLIASLRELVLKSKSLSPSDVRISNEAAKEQEQALQLDTGRITTIVNQLKDFIDEGAPGPLAQLVSDLDTLVTADDIDDMISNLDDLMNRLSNLFIQISRFGISQTGIGFVYQWQQTTFNQLREKLETLITLWETNESECGDILAEYEQGVIDGLSDPELYKILTKADLKVSTATTQHKHSSPADYFLEIRDTKLSDYSDFLANQIRPIRDQHTLSAFMPDMQAMQAQLSDFDIVGIDIEDQIKQIKVFVADLHVGAQNLKTAVQNKTENAEQFITSAGASGDALKSIDFAKSAAKELFGDDFVIVPEFSVEEPQATEWQNTVLASESSLRYLTDDEDIDFPMDDWLYGVSRVRDKINHLENTLFHSEGFNGASLNLLPLQFPYRQDDYWLGMQYPQTVPDPENPAEEIPFTIDEDKLLFTSVYVNSYAFDQLESQCGLLIDEWTEVIPTRDETAGLTFHYDQPNTEPPQTLLLATPSQFTGTWQWDDLVNTLDETLAMAKKRAVEPDHIDDTVYSRFLPAIISLASPVPLTATLNLALNNYVQYVQVNLDA